MIGKNLCMACAGSLHVGVLVHTHMYGCEAVSSLPLSSRPKAREVEVDNLYSII